MGLDSHRAPEAWCFRRGTLQTQSCQDWCFQTGTFQAEIPNAASDRLAPSLFYPLSGAVDAASRDFSLKSKVATRRETREFGLESYSRGIVFPKGDITDPKCRGLVFPEGDIAGPNPQHGF